MWCFVQSTGIASFAMRSRRRVNEQVRRLLGQKEMIEVLELNVQTDHVHMVVWIPPKYAVSEVMGYLKGKLAIRATVLGAAFVGTRLLCEHSWHGRREDT